MSKSSLILAGACFLAIACKPERKAPETGSASAKASAKASASRADSTALIKARYVSARQYLPAGCNIAAEVNVQELFDTPLVGPQLLAGLVMPKDPQLRAQVMADPEQASFLGFLQAAKIEPQQDLKTVAVCIPDGEGSSEPRYLAIIAGEFPDGLVEIFRDHAPPGKKYTVEPLGAGRALFREGKWASQGAANVVLFGNDKDLILAAREPSKAYESYDLTSARDINVTLSEKSLASLDGPPNDPLVSLLRRGKRVQLDVDLSAGDLKGVVTLPDAEAVNQFENAIKELRSQMKLQSELAPPQLRHMLQPSIDLLEKARLSKDGQRLGFAVTLPAGMLEAALQQMLMSWFGSGVTPTAPGATMAPVVPGHTGRPAAPLPRRRVLQDARRPQQAKASRSPAPLAPLPNLPSFQLTPPSVLENKSVPTTPLAQPNEPSRTEPVEQPGLPSGD